MVVIRETRVVSRSSITSGGLTIKMDRKILPQVYIKEGTVHLKPPYFNKKNKMILTGSTLDETCLVLILMSRTKLIPMHC